MTDFLQHLGLFGASIVFIWSVIQFMLTRDRERRIHEFEAFHRLIKELVSPDPETNSTWIDRQVAAVFELRHFPRYYEVTERILENLKSKWGKTSAFKWPILLNEIDLTLNYIEKKRR